jgi:uncharacterized protein
MSPRSKKSASGKSPLSSILFGALFGYLLSKAGATDYDTIAGMFIYRGFKSAAAPYGAQTVPSNLQFPFTEFQLYGVLLVTLAVVILGLLVMRIKRVPDRQGEAIEFKAPKFEWNRMPGGLIFGAGWVLVGACPGTAIAQLGEGKLAAVFTVLGVLLGTWLYVRFMGDPGPDCDN